MAIKVVYSVVAVLGIAAASVAAYWYQSKPKGPQEVLASGPGASPGTAGAPAAGASAARPAGVEVARVERVTLQDDAQSVGSLRSRQSVMMRPEVAGRVKELGFSDGARVRRGQVLVQLDDTLQRAEIKQASAQVSIAQANFKRNQELVAQSFVAQRVLEESSANLQVAEAQLALACARLSRMAIVAPFDGTVGMRNVNLGDFVKDGADLINLEDISSMYVDFRLPERFQNKLRLRQTVELQLDAMPGRVFKATVEAIDPLLDVNGRSVGVRAVLPNTMGEAVVQRGGVAANPRAPTSAPAGAGSAGKPAPGGGAAMPMRQGNARPGAAAPNAEGEGSRPAMGRVLTDANGCPVSPDFVAAANLRPNVPGAAPAGVPVTANRPVGAASGTTGAPAGVNQAPLRPGMFARVTTVFAIREMALVVPEEAIVPQGGRQFVVKVVEPAAVPAASAEPLPPESKLVSLRQEVKLGARQSGKVEITDGLVEGETVVTAGQQRLQRDGSPVRVVDLGRPAQGGVAPVPRSAAASGPAAAASR